MCSCTAAGPHLQLGEGESKGRQAQKGQEMTYKVTTSSVRDKNNLNGTISGPVHELHGCQNTEPKQLVVAWLMMMVMGMMMRRMMMMKMTVKVMLTVKACNSSGADDDNDCVHYKEK